LPRPPIREREGKKRSDSNEARRAIERQPEEESPLYAEVISFLLSKNMANEQEKKKKKTTKRKKEKRCIG
jgi:hypothetical protein